jgi:hypothetical protein
MAKQRFTTEEIMHGSGASADAEADHYRIALCGYLRQSSLPLLLKGPLLWSAPADALEPSVIEHSWLLR